MRIWPKRRGLLDKLDALEQTHDLQEAQDLDDAKNALAAADRNPCVAIATFLERPAIIKIED